MYKFLRWQHVCQNATTVNPLDDYVDPNHLTVCIKSVPAWVTIDMIQDQTNCTNIYFSEPLKMSDFDRICWLKFNNQADYEAQLARKIHIESQSRK